MQNLDVKDTIQKIKNTKPEIKKELKGSITNEKWNENTDMQEKGKCTTNEKYAEKVVQEFQEIIKNKKRDILWLAYHQGQIFQKFKEKERFIKMVLKFDIIKLILVLKIALSKPIDNYPKIKNSSLSRSYFKKHLKMIREICKENASEFK